MPRSPKREEAITDVLRAPGIGHDPFLDKIQDTLNWTRFQALLSGVPRTTTEFADFPPLSMYKALLLGTWYQLSDIDLADTLDDHIGFYFFLDLPPKTMPPDDDAITQFRSALSAAGLSLTLEQELQRQTKAANLQTEPPASDRELIHKILRGPILTPNLTSFDPPVTTTRKPKRKRKR